MSFQKSSLAFVLMATLTASLRADIFRWDNGQLIPGTEGITPGPGVELSDWNEETHNLRYADFGGADLTGAYLYYSTLTHANLSGANLTNAQLFYSTLTHANLSGANVTGASFLATTDRGFTRAQLESTASYQAKDLKGIGLSYNDLTGWDFSGQNLTNADLEGSTLTNVNLSGAVVTGASLGGTTSLGFTEAQLESTASYQEKNLQGIGLWNNDLNGWDFSGQNLAGANFGFTSIGPATGADLTNANLSHANLTGAQFGGDFHAILINADLSDAVVNRANFANMTPNGFTKEQLYATASYQAKDLEGIGLSYNDLAGWNFTGQNLTNANLYSSKLTNANLTGAVVTWAFFWETTSRGFTQAQLASTTSYQTKNLQGIGLAYNDLTGWDFSGQNLTSASLYSSRLTNANLTGAVVTGTSFGDTTSRGFTQEQLYSTASYKSKELARIELSSNDLSGWNLSGQNLAGASFRGSTLANADLSQANLAGANLENTTLISADLTGADLRGVRFARLAGTISRNTINPQGLIRGVDLRSGETLVVRDNDGVPDPPPVYWLTPRPPIRVRMQDHVTMAEGSVLQLRFEMDPWDSLISFDPAIPVQLGGTLELTFVDDVDVPKQVGRTLDIFDWTGVEPIGAFTVASPYLWDLSNLYTTGEVCLTGTGGVADVDQSGLVDQGDLDLVLLNWGNELIDPLSVGWTNDLPIGLVDQSELDKVLLNWGRSTAVSTATTAAVPEPTGTILGLLALTVVLMHSKSLALSPKVS
jgi:uncharacterized protein YjbI with pentapeptide repeats